MELNRSEYLPRLIAFEVTRSCYLNCSHCRAGASKEKFNNELSFKEVCKILESISALNKPIVILTGGEPMLREDIYDIAAYGSELGLKMVMAPCGYMLDIDSVDKIKKSGIKTISLSIDGANSDTHDKLRGKKGAFDRVMKAARCAKENGLDFQVNTTVHKNNISELSDIHELAVDLGAKAFHSFLLVPVGRGESMKEQEISPDQYEEVLNWIYKTKKESRMFFHPTCAPMFNRIILQNEKVSELKRPLSKGCLGGKSFYFISHTGKVQICGFMEEEAGDLRKNSYNFTEIWQESELFNKLRNYDLYKGKCGKCEYIYNCGGCRARAFSLRNDCLEAEPMCIYIPKRS